MAGTAILLIDPYNDFLHENGKLYHVLADSIKVTDTVTHLHALVTKARASKIPIFYCMHQQTNKYTFANWQYLNKSQQGLQSKEVFEEGSFGAQYFEGMEPDLNAGDVVVSKHWNSSELFLGAKNNVAEIDISSFANTDLDYQLSRHGIKKLVLAGLITNTCVESTARYAYELGYELTMLSDATAGFSVATKDAAVNLIWPLFANRICTVAEWAESLDGDPKL